MILVPLLVLLVLRLLNLPCSRQLRPEPIRPKRSTYESTRRPSLRRPAHLELDPSARGDIRVREDRGRERPAVDGHALDVRLRGGPRGGDNEGLRGGWQVDGHFVEEGPTYRGEGRARH